MSFSMAYAAGHDRLLSLLEVSYRRLVLSSIGLGIVVIILGIALAELLLGFESALEFENTRIWPLHLGGALGLMSLLVLMMGILPTRNDMLSLLRKFDAQGDSGIEARLAMLARRVQVMSLGALGLSLVSAGLMAFSRAVS